MWREGSGTCEVWVLLGFVEAPLPLLVSITGPGPSQPAMWNGSRSEGQRPGSFPAGSQLHRLQQSAWSRALPAENNPCSAPFSLRDLSEPQFLFSVKLGEPGLPGRVGFG